MEPLNEIIGVDMSSESCHCGFYFENELFSSIFR